MQSKIWPFSVDQGGIARFEKAEIQNTQQPIAVHPAPFELLLDAIDVTKRKIGARALDANDIVVRIERDRPLEPG